MPKQKRSFVVPVELELSVKAFDATSAQRKVERALRRAQKLDEDVATTERIWIYDASTEPAE